MEKRYYVYVYLDQRKPGIWSYEDKIFEFQPFYIGKGTGKRETIHTTPSMLKIKSFKTSVIKSIISETNELPMHYRVYDEIDQTTAVDLEIKMIKHFGRRDIQTGILSNCTDGGDGTNNLSKEKRNRKALRKQVFQYDLSGNFIKMWDSPITVEETIGICRTGISESAIRSGTCEHFFWSYNYLGEKIEPKKRHNKETIYNKIQQINIETDEVVAEFNSAKEAAEKLNLNKSARNKILDVALGKLNRHGNPNKTYMGFKWKTF
jgi:hypothetical protein